MRSAHAQSASLPPRNPSLIFWDRACQNLQCWRVLRGLSVGVGGARTNTAGRQCVLSCASAYSRVRRGARQRETDNGVLREDLIGRDSIIFFFAVKSPFPSPDVLPAGGGWVVFGFTVARLLVPTSPPLGEKWAAPVHN